MNVEEYVEKLRQAYVPHIDIDYANWSKEYFRNQFEFLGVRTPIRKKVLKEFIKEYGIPDGVNLKEVVVYLWNCEEREFQKTAMDILDKQKKLLAPEDMEWLLEITLSKSWWDTIDVLAPHIFGFLFSKYPELIEEYADKWIEDDNFWLQRAAILFQLNYKDKMNEELLHKYIYHRLDSEEFFIQKAIGWVLRQYGRTNPDNVREFVNRTNLKPLSRREALKNL